MFILEDGKQFADSITIALLPSTTFIYKLWRRRRISACELYLVVQGKIAILPGGTQEYLCSPCCAVVAVLNGVGGRIGAQEGLK